MTGREDVAVFEPGTSVGGDDKGGGPARICGEAAVGVVHGVADVSVGSRPEVPELDQIQIVWIFTQKLFLPAVGADKYFRRDIRLANEEVPACGDGAGRIALYAAGGKIGLGYIVGKAEFLSPRAGAGQLGISAIKVLSINRHS